MNYAIAVIDIGMTNKKIAVYDDSLRQLDAKYRQFPPVRAHGERGGVFEAHDLEAMEAWFFEELRNFAANYPVKALAVSTHGAAFVCLGKDGAPALPCVYYTYEPADTDGGFHRRFYERFGAAEDLQARTGTAPFDALLNLAKGIVFAQEAFPQGFSSAAAIVPYPQYWGFRLTGEIGAECTYLGCHTYLWDQIDNRFSDVARALGITPLMPRKLMRPCDVLGKLTKEAAQKTGLSQDTLVTMGIHDSNASLLPHFAKRGERGFVLNSTGTWCVVMNPVKNYGFAPDELGKTVFFNISAFGAPLKTAIFLGGQEFERRSNLLRQRCGRGDIPGWNEPLYRSILKEKMFSPPESPEGDYEAEFAFLRISLVRQTLTALQQVGLEKGQDVFIEGGFRRDEAYSRLLALALPDNRVFLTGVAEATALGAAMTAKMALSGKNLSELAEDFTIEYVEQEKIPFDEGACYDFNYRT